MAKAADLLAERRTGKQVLVVDAGKGAALCVPAEGDTVATIGDAPIKMKDVDESDAETPESP